jgi:hypothetical protein
MHRNITLYIVYTIIFFHCMLQSCRRSSLVNFFKVKLKITSRCITAAHRHANSRAYVC